MTIVTPHCAANLFLGCYQDCFACFRVFLCLAWYVLRDYCRLHRDQYGLGGKSPPRRSTEITFLEEDSVTDFAVHPNSQEDEAVFRQALGNLGRSAEKNIRMVLVTLFCHLFADMIATCPPGILERRLANHPARVGVPAALEGSPSVRK